MQILWRGFHALLFIGLDEPQILNNTAPFATRGVFFKASCFLSPHQYSKGHRNAPHAHNHNSVNSPSLTAFPNWPTLRPPRISNAGK